jgi:hypothetical protein
VTSPFPFLEPPASEGGHPPPQKASHLGTLLATPFERSVIFSPRKFSNRPRSNLDQEPPMPSKKSMTQTAILTYDAQP